MTISKSYQVLSYYYPTATSSGYTTLSSTDFSSSSRITFSNDSNATIWIRLASGTTGQPVGGIKIPAYGGMAIIEGYNGPISAMHTFPAAGIGLVSSTAVTKTLGVVIE